MARLALKYVRVGMELSRSVSNAAGSMLVNEGEIITEETLQRLVNAHVAYVFVADRLDDTRLEKELASLEARFEVTSDRPHMGRLKRLLREHLEELYS